ncbi:Pro isomerase domain-containing protein [Zymoseptoria brevis]|uniref:peptidylprolyl isomerase n=1 Tax=Zymoseptoria brevis TaxID=1047168 RepID=A0A0F4GAF1_9PEZI|nr:Pro isomerase domain-containing protein [Zymoseptoria brevis]
MAAANRPRVFLDVSIGEEPAGRLTIELFADKTPKTAENFRQLCTGEHNGLSYAKAPFHRVIDEFMVQGGDIASGDGTGTTSIYDGEFDDENLDWREMDAAGLVCSANRGKNTNGSQFFLTLEACPHLNGKHTIFGRLVGGDDTLAKIAKVKVDGKDCPVTPVLVSRCGELEKKRKPQQQKRDSRQENVISETSVDDRGRRRKSDLSADEMDASPPPHARRNRRQSDNVVDEGKRGRVRVRSRSRSNSQPLKETEEGDVSDTSSAKLHKRKRSPSPSRLEDRRAEHADTDGEDEERRRRSLPNQYRQRQDQRRDHDDEARYRPSPRRDDGRHSKRDNDRFRPSRGRYADNGRLGGSGGGRLGDGGGGGYDEPVKYKGRGAMKFREPDRAW